MVVSIHIGFRQCGKKTISVIVDYTIKARQLNPTTVIYVLDVELLDGGEIKNHLCIRFLVPIHEACNTSFHDFLEKFIRSPYHWFCFKLHWRFWADDVLKQVDFPKQQLTALYILRDFMFLKGITIIEHNDLFRWCHFSPMNLIWQCSDTRKKTRKLWATRILIVISRWKFQKVF